MEIDELRSVKSFMAAISKWLNDSIEKQREIQEEVTPQQKAEQ